jgi:ubiquinol-cytochrome c reductase cytochrome c1 subunit
MATETSVKVLAAAALLALGAPAFAAGGGAMPFPFKPDTTNFHSLQRGAKYYMSYCSGCHSLKYLRYNRLGQDLNIPEDMLKKHLMFTSERTGDHIKTSMPGASADPTQPSASEKWFGRAPPDLSLTARERGADWIYSYLLTFYLDPGKPTGVNNLVLPGASMPHVLGELQGYQRLVEEKKEEGHGGHHKPKFELVRAGSLAPDEYKEVVADLTNFMVYAAEPGRNRRIGLGVLVLTFTLVFGFLCYLLKHEYWKDVH